MFFKESSDFANRNSQLFDFIHTSSAALWNLRWQVQGFVAVTPKATDRELSGRFTSGSGISANNLRGTCIDTPWDDQLGQFAQIVSANLIAMYEGWAEELMLKFGNGSLGKWVQWPSKGSYGQTRNGVGEALAAARATGVSADMEKAFHPAYAGQRKYSLSHLDALLVLYRYHKEIRNSYMHRGGVANQDAVRAWQNASALTRADIGGRSAPMVTQVVNGAMVGADIRESIQLSDVLLRIVCTIDAELCFTDLGERNFLAGWRGNESNRKFAALPGDPLRREKRLARICRKAGYVSPSDTEAIRRIGYRAGLITP
ncbi:hypothetical protein [Streptomyces sp. NPDC085529]|uniref:hypothetical protein n=1 Tax=Streptomyces sp. NPDC085529 TaxID=3365729 RepID=UPI0037CDE879